MNQKQTIYVAALKRIGQRAMSTHDLGVDLRKKFPDQAELIDEVIQEMVDLHLLSDVRYAEQLIHHLTARPIGRQKLWVECRRHGLSQSEMETQLQAIEYNEWDMIQAAYHQKQNSLSSSIEERAFKQKMMLFLRGRGFSDALIYKVIAHS
ncbi:regulatory protein RecX [Candidatus Peregrinibacteria bacterium]|nr:MAG: regulatory protein RecX [Candidatus Peregrinibacteria bacterium]